jgi:predicted TIM-barrel fold metal-dependent hydrolase
MSATATISEPQSTPSIPASQLIIDTDSHISEPPDLWTSRLPSKWGDEIPRVIFDERHQIERWLIGGKKITGAAGFASAGWPEFPPSFPPTMDQADPAAYDAKARLAKLDEFGIYSQVLYPNLLAFFLFAFRRMSDPRLAIDCVRAYNDFLVEFAEPAPDRFINLMALPFWDVPEAVAELERAHEIGHRGVLLIGKPHKIGMPGLHEDYWEPIFKVAQERQLSINFHTGFQEWDEADFHASLGKKVDRVQYARDVSLSHLGAAETVTDLLYSGVCIRYPDLKFVIVESGVGWLRYYLEVLDWQWVNSGAVQQYPDRDKPSDYFKRQVYGTFWFEQESVGRIVDLYPDNIMFESDFPHPTSLSPGPTSSSKMPREMVAGTLAGVPEDIQRKVLYDNAAKLYHVRGPEHG